jgi:acetyltransferase-like isoleucine patch superfamily enzyme
MTMSENSPQRTMRDRIEQGLLFTDGCEGLPQERAAAKRAMTAFNTADLTDTPTRVRLQADLLGTTPREASGFWIEPPFGCCYGSRIRIGRGTYINMNCMFVDDARITLGNRVMMGPAVCLATTSHPINPAMREYMYCDPISIGDDCWIGAGATICPGVTIGSGTVIGAGSVVTKDIPPNVVAVGNPCRVLRPIGAEDMSSYRPGRPFDPEDLEEERRLRGR